MDWEIGELKQIKGEWYQCVEGNCAYCSIEDEACEQRILNDVCKLNRIFKKLEKVGEPYMTGNKLIQRYKIYPTTCCINIYGWYYQNLDVKSWTIDIELKQNKEDMEENKLNLKPFDIQKAREGKPVCTRDGRKARIICFDTKGDPCPIIALVEENGIEAAYHYDKNGQNAYNKSELDLMMLPEKKEGWANIVRGSDGKSHMGRGIFQSKEEAKDAIKAFSDNLIDTVKIFWEE